MSKLSFNMHLLVIEDNDIKYQLIEQCLEEARVQVTHERAASYQSGLKRLLSETERFDYVILDMTLPAYDVRSGVVSISMFTFGGEGILRECARKSAHGRFIILTQYDVFVRDQKEITFEELKSELRRKFDHQIVECLRMDTSSIKWKADLLALIERI